MAPSLFERIQQRIELFRLEQRYTRRRNRRSTFVSTAVYVDGEYIYNTPNTTGSSTGTTATNNNNHDADLHTTNAMAPVSSSLAAARAPATFFEAEDDAASRRSTTPSHPPPPPAVAPGRFDRTTEPSVLAPDAFMPGGSTSTDNVGEMSRMQRQSTGGGLMGSLAGRGRGNKRHSVAFGALPGFGSGGVGPSAPPPANPAHEQGTSWRNKRMSVGDFR